MRISAAILMLVLSAAAQEKVQPSAALEGTVLDARTGNPIAGARVNPIPFNNNGTFTNEKGTFSLHSLTPRRFQLLVDAPGHVGQTVVIDLASGERRDGVEIRLEQTGVISGRVVDSNGKPLVGIRPQTMVYTHSFPGSNFFVVARSDQSDVVLHPLERGRTDGTNDRGEFRIFNLPPGEYLLRIASPTNPTLGAVLYPGVADTLKAISIRVSAGEEVRLPDVMLSPSAFGWITARIADVPGEISTRNIADHNLTLIRKDGNHIDAAQKSSPPAVRPDAPGSYIICANIHTNGGAAANCRTVEYSGAEMELDFRPTKLDGRLNGRILVEHHDGAAPMPASGITVAATGIEKPGVWNQLTCKDDGSFAETGLIPGPARISSLIRRPGQGNPNYYLASVRQGDRNVLTDGMIITDQESNLEILVSALGGVARGKITDADGHLLPNATVALVPEGDLSKRNDLDNIYRTDQSDIDGIYEIRGLIPGSYRAYATTRPEGWAYWDSEYMKQYEAIGKSIRVEKGGSASADLIAIANDIEAAK